MKSSYFNEKTLELLQSPVRHIEAKISIGSQEFTTNDRLISFTVDRIGESSRFFGFGITQKINIKLIDKDRELSFTTDDSIIVYLPVKDKITFDSGNYQYVDKMASFFTKFKVTEVHRDENTNELSITGYDLLSIAFDKYTVADLNLPTREREVVLEDGTTALDDEGNPIMETVYYYSLADFASGCSELVCYQRTPTYYSNNQYLYWNHNNQPLTFEIARNDNIANFSGDESLKEAIDDFAEIHGVVYWIDTYTDRLLFKQLAPPSTVTHGATASLQINRDDYFTLTSGDNRRLSKLVAATDLGDNYEADTGVTGTTQYIKNNDFWATKEGTTIAYNLENLLDRVGGLTNNQFEMSWRGNYLLQPADLMKIETKDGDVVTCYLLDDSITYNGAFTEKTRWKYEDVGEDVTGNPTTIGEALNETFAKVDKINKQIDIVASEIEENREEIGAIRVNTDNISLSVESIEKSLTESTDTINGQLEEIQKKVELGITSEDVTIQIQETLKDGVSSVTTETGFTFNNEGLTIDKSDSEMKTQITEDGMVVYKNDEAMLTANNTGVYAQNLHATTYLIVGKCSRFEDYEKDGEARTGCFWLGGN